MNQQSAAGARGGELLMCLSTVASRADGDRIADVLLTQRLAACVQIHGPIISHYVWQQQRRCDQEFRLVIKTTAAAWPRLLATLLELHPYDEPQIIAIPIAAASDGYRNWVSGQVEP